MVKSPTATMIEHAGFTATIQAPDDARIGASAFIEAPMIIEARYGEPEGRELYRIAGNLGFTIVTFDTTSLPRGRDFDA